MAGVNTNPGPSITTTAPRPARSPAPTRATSAPAQAAPARDRAQISAEARATTPTSASHKAHVTSLSANLGETGGMSTRSEVSGSLQGQRFKAQGEARVRTGVQFEGGRLEAGHYGEAKSSLEADLPGGLHVHSQGQANFRSGLLVQEDKFRLGSWVDEHSK